MADEKHQATHESNLVDKTKSTSDKEFSDSKTRHKVGRRGLIFTVVILSMLVLGLVATTGYMLAGGYVRHSSLVDDSGFTAMSRVMRFGGDRSGIGYGSYVNTQVSGDTVTTTVYTTQTGVVTAVNSDNIVIAGNGKQTTVKTNSSTQYDNGTKPAVNDTVTVVGTTVDNTTTATEIGVVNS